MFKTMACNRVLDFSDDVDNQQDESGKFTSAYVPLDFMELLFSGIHEQISPLGFPSY